MGGSAAPIAKEDHWGFAPSGPTEQPDRSHHENSLPAPGTRGAVSKVGLSNELPVVVTTAKTVSLLEMLNKSENEPQPKLDLTLYSRRVARITKIPCAESTAPEARCSHSGFVKNIEELSAELQGL